MLLAAACGGGGGDDAPPGAQQAPPVLSVARVFQNLTFSQPIALLQAPNDASRWFVVEQAGTVRVFANNPQVSSPDEFANITGRVVSGGEMGLLGMAFHPRFPNDPRVFFNYTTGNLVTHISEFMLGGDGTIDEGRERILLTIDQPQGNHNGGHLAFGRDGFLYIGMGDGGGGNDEPNHGPIGNGQRMTTVLGKMLRIDVDSAVPYGIPPDNPFAATGQLCNANGNSATNNCAEIYASGFRNPWRWSFDRATGDLWVGDVGQGALEEIDRVERRGNYGWRCFEGTQATGLACGAEPDLIPPIAEYGRSEGVAVTGGYVYRGSAIPALQGRYVFADFVSGHLWHIAADTQPTLRMGTGFQSGLNIASFAEDLAGELYVVDYGGGLYRLTGN